ncbi:hypothetical protein NQ176_g10364 [Zarea fungicola]|uniref:Uncharacterized protein n=1 Tax=Zarea fungicola TaxID=93591 RepID=A0ACC1MGP8_9HYPO|nr:hypothetical protein NQ176_g10364 [Lecanicillium fungicola]
MPLTIVLKPPCEPTYHGEKSGLLGLPLEIRRIIILHVFKHRHRKAPLLTKKVLSDRIRLRNRFDDKYPIETNIYVCRQKSYIHANALLQTNRQLRQDTLDIIQDTLKTGKVKIPFVLDLMVIKDVGLLPTWMSCPYLPENIKRLKVNVRVFRPDKDIIPESWIPAAVYGGREWSYEFTVCEWNFFVVLLFYAMGRLSPSSENTIREQPETEPVQHMDKLSLGQQPPGVSVYISAKAPYTVDELYLNVEKYEYYANGKFVLPYVEDWNKSSLWYKEGYYTFGRTIFTDDLLENDDDRIIVRVLKAGTLGTGQVSGIGGTLKELAYEAGDSHPWHTSYGYVTMQIYLDALARNIKTVKTAYNERAETSVGDAGHWESLLGYYFESDDIVKAFKKEKSKEDPNEHVLHWFRLVKRRMDLGWWDDDHYKRLWHGWHPAGAPFRSFQ